MNDNKKKGLNKSEQFDSYILTQRLKDSGGMGGNKNRQLKHPPGNVLKSIGARVSGEVWRLSFLCIASANGITKEEQGVEWT